MKEKDIKPYALNFLSREFGLSQYQYNYAGSTCDFIAIDKKCTIIEVEHKSDYLGLEMGKEAVINNVRHNKHELTLSGGRVGQFYFLFPARFYHYYVENSPERYGLISYEISSYGNMDITLVRYSDTLSRKRESKSFLFHFASGCSIYHDTPNSFKPNKRAIQFLDANNK